MVSNCAADPTAAMKAIAEIAAEPMTLSQNEWHLVSNTAGHLTLKHLIADDKERSASPETGQLNTGTTWHSFSHYFSVLLHCV